MKLPSYGQSASQTWLRCRFPSDLADVSELQNLFEALLSLARTSGAEFCEIFCEESLQSSLKYVNGVFDAYTPVISGGVAIRILHKDQTGFAYTFSLSYENLKWTLEKSLASVGLSLPSGHEKMNFVDLPPCTDYTDWGQKLVTAEKLIPFSSLRFLMENSSEKFHKQIPHVVRTSIGLARHIQTVVVANSEGIFSKDLRLQHTISGDALSETGPHKTMQSKRFGTTSQMEYFENFDFVGKLIDPLTQSVGTMLKADTVTAGDYPLVLNAGTGGVIFHEACGHLLETTSLFYKRTPFSESIGKPIAHEAVTAYDDGRILGAFGSLDMDDEGMKTTRTLLIEDGILRNFLSDREGARVFKLPRTGSARRQNFQYIPTSRMRNTFITPGKYSPQELIASVDHGIYCERLGGGSVNSIGEFNFGCEEAFEIKNGVLGKPLKGAVVLGKATEILKRISMVANDLALQPGFCGSSSGTVYVTTGQPHIKVDSLSVGGK